MNKRRQLSLLILLMFLAIVSYACNRSTDSTKKDSCAPLPDWFSETSLNGTWVAKSASQHISDTIMINLNGSYTQIIQTEYTSTIYNEGKWHFEYRENKTGYLHMEGLRICGANPENSCEWTNDGKTLWADACEGQWIEPRPAKGEIILVVLGYAFPFENNENASHPFSLTLFRGFENSPWTYYFEGQ
jgi:hypothetical protein